MKKTIIILLGAVVALSGCKHSEIPGEEAPVSGRRLVAEATLGDGVKSHFGEDGYNLVWDSTDKLLVYSNYMGSWENYQSMIEDIKTEYQNENISDDDAGIIAYFRLLRDNAAQRYAGTFSISSNGAGQATAEFVSDGPASSWMASGADEDLYYFLPFYPAPATFPEIKNFTFEEVGEDSPFAAEAPFPYLNFTIQPVQDGVNYQNYQLLMGGTDGPSVKGNLIAGEKIPFDNFMPLTSILEFTMQTSSGSGEIDHMDITLSTQEEADAVYVSNKYMIAGNVPLFFSWDEPNEMRFWNRACKPFLGGFGSSWNDYHHDFEATGWEGHGSDATSTLRLQFDSPVSVNASGPTAQKYYAVVIPSRCIHKDGCGNPKLTFDAYNAEGEKIFTKTIETTSTQGIEEGKKYPFNLVLEDPMLGVPLTLEALEDGTTVTIANSAGVPVFQYSKDNQSWSMAGGENSVTISLDAGECVYLKGDNATYYISSNPTTILPDKACYIYGNIMSLVDSDDFKNCTEITGSYAFFRMFNSANILNHQTKKLLLPATKLTNSCYGQMFSGCTSLTAAPELPATELANHCYSSMFSGCTSLTAAPELPATTLATGCYDVMFRRCTSLTTAPELPATTLAQECYYGMFSLCTSLTTAPELPATRLAGSCYVYMFDGCSNLNYVKCLASVIPSGSTRAWLYGVSSEGTFVKNASATWETGISGIPEGWTVEDAN